MSYSIYKIYYYYLHLLLLSSLTSDYTINTYTQYTTHLPLRPLSLSISLSLLFKRKRPFFSLQKYTYKYSRILILSISSKGDSFEFLLLQNPTFFFLTTSHIPHKKRWQEQQKRTFQLSLLSHQTQHRTTTKKAGWGWQWWS